MFLYYKFCQVWLIVIFFAFHCNYVLVWRFILHRQLHIVTQRERERERERETLQYACSCSCITKFAKLQGLEGWFWKLTVLVNMSESPRISFCEFWMLKVYLCSFVWFSLIRVQITRCARRQEIQWCYASYPPISLKVCQILNKLLLKQESSPGRRETPV